MMDSRPTPQDIRDYEAGNLLTEQDMEQQYAQAEAEAEMEADWAAERANEQYWENRGTAEAELTDHVERQRGVIPFDVAMAS